MSDNNLFENLNFDKFRELAKSDQLSRHEKVGFPDSYREGKEPLIFSDVCNKLLNLRQRGKTVLEIGPGCSQLPVLLEKLCADQDHRLLLADSQEMLDLLPDAPNTVKYPGCYPNLPALFAQYTGRIDVIICYSVIQYIFLEGNLWNFVDLSLSLLSEGGEILLGDIPNSTMRKRFFSSSAGIACHKAYVGKDETPTVTFNTLDPGAMDDSVVLAILARVRAQGFHGWVVPQAADLPMANRREDILIKRP